MTGFAASVAHYCEGYIVAPGCRGETCEHSEGDPDHRCEAGFSSAQCDSCGSTFGGDREPGSMLPIDKRGAFDYSREAIDCVLCVDCVLYWANGDEPEDWHRTPQDMRRACDGDQ